MDMDAQMQMHHHHQDASGTDMIALQKVGATATATAARRTRPDDWTALSAPLHRCHPPHPQPLISVITSLRVCICVFSLLSLQLHSAPVIPLYSLDNYTFGTKEQQREKDPNVKMRMERMERVGVAARAQGTARKRT